MNIRDLVPWNRNKQKLPNRGAGHPVSSLQHKMNRLFDDFFGGSLLEPFRGWETNVAAFTPRVDVTETDRELTVTAELPGMDEKDVDVSLTGDTLTIRGEKRQEEEKKDKDYFRRECSYGSFQRVIPLPSEIDRDKIDATFKKGLLKVTLPKSQEEAAHRKRIAVKSA